MNPFFQALWAETLKARRSKISWLTAAATLLLPLVDGLFMIILKDPVRAQSMGLISAKAQLAAGSADWSTFLSVLLQGMSIAGSILFAILTAWVFGREFSDHTAKEWLALPTGRSVVVAAKFCLIILWTLLLTLLVYVVGLGIGRAVDIPGWSTQQVWTSFGQLIVIALLTTLLMPVVAWFASVGRGYLPPLGWAFLAMAFGQIAAVLGWGDWFPWSVPALLTGLAGPPEDLLGLHSYLMVGLVFIAGTVATLAWWGYADQSR